MDDQEADENMTYYTVHNMNICVYVILVNIARIHRPAFIPHVLHPFTTGQLLNRYWRLKTWSVYGSYFQIKQDFEIRFGF